MPLEKFKNSELIGKYIKGKNFITGAYKCRHCLECLNSKKYDWLLRCQNEKLAGWKNIYFITLTFDNDHYSIHGKKRLLSYWVKNNLARFLGRQNFKYFAVSEYGEKTGRFHFHMLLYTNFIFDDLQQLGKSHKARIQQYKSEFLCAYWKYGLHTITKVCNDKALMYCIKYSSKSQHLKVYCSRGFGNKVYNFQAVNFKTLPKSILTNAYTRLYNAKRSLMRGEISKEQYNVVFKENEPYNRLKWLMKQKGYCSKYYLLSHISSYLLKFNYITRHMHKQNTKNVL